MTGLIGWGFSRVIGVIGVVGVIGVIGVAGVIRVAGVIEVIEVIEVIDISFANGIVLSLTSSEAITSLTSLTPHSK